MLVCFCLRKNCVAGSFLCSCHDPIQWAGFLVWFQICKKPRPPYWVWCPSWVWQVFGLLPLAAVVAELWRLSVCWPKPMAVLHTSLWLTGLCTRAREGDGTEVSTWGQRTKEERSAHGLWIVWGYHWERDLGAWSLAWGSIDWNG